MNNEIGDDDSAASVCQGLRLTEERRSPSHCRLPNILDKIHLRRLMFLWYAALTTGARYERLENMCRYSFSISSGSRAVMWAVMEERDNCKHCSLVRCNGLAERYSINGG